MEERHQGDPQLRHRVFSGLATPQSPNALGTLEMEPHRSSAQAIRPRSLGSHLDHEQPDHLDNATLIGSGPSASYEYGFGALKGGWQHLDRDTRYKISSVTNAANSPPVAWDRIVIHSSGTGESDPRVVAAYHRSSRGFDDMAYHFLITEDKDPKIAVAQRWSSQRPAANGDSAIHLCIAGDFDEQLVGEAQLRALHELVSFLRARIGDVPLVLHDPAANSRRAGCLGRNFPRQLVLDALN